MDPNAVSHLVELRNVAASHAPREDYVVLRVLKQENETSGGLVMPKNSQRKAKAHAVVLSIGPGLFENNERKPVGLKAGDRVVMEPNAPFVPLEPTGTIVMSREAFVIAEIVEPSQERLDAIGALIV